MLVKLPLHMPKSLANQDVLLGAIAKQLSERYKMEVPSLLIDLVKLDELVKRGVDWGLAAEHAQTTRHELYRWYHDTFQRNLYGPVSHHDIQIIRAALIVAAELHSPLDKQFQRELKTKLSQEYHRNSFTVAFNNQRRLVAMQQGVKFYNKDIDMFVRELECIVMGCKRD